jgi:hypothetical protein
VRIAARDPAAEDLRFAIREIPADGKDLYVTLEMTAEPVPGHPAEMARFAQVGVSGGMIDLMAAPPLVTGIKLRGAAQQGPLDQARGASFRRRSTTIDGTTLPAYFVHPPYKNGTGSTFWTQEVDVPETYELRFSIGMGELSPERSDGVRFEVHAAKVDDGTVGTYEKLFEATSKAHQWLAQTVALGDLSGNRVRFKFVADCGPQDNATTDHAYWGNVRLVRSGTDDRQITEARQHMTWVNDRLFTSTFYYRHVQSETVNLSVTVEGSPPVTIRCVTAHAHPDAIYREFENGLVLANPSHWPYTFDLQRLTPGRRYRRLQATPAQDVETNNGQPVGTTVTLGERDALFLLRTD